MSVVEYSQIYSDNSNINEICQDLPFLRRYLDALHASKSNFLKCLEQI